MSQILRGADEDGYTTRGSAIYWYPTGDKRGKMQERFAGKA